MVAGSVTAGGTVETTMTPMPAAFSDSRATRALARVTASSVAALTVTPASARVGTTFTLARVQRPHGDDRLVERRLIEPAYERGDGRGLIARHDPANVARLADVTALATIPSLPNVTGLANVSRVAAVPRGDDAQFGACRGGRLGVGDQARGERRYVLGQCHLGDAEPLGQQRPELAERAEHGLLRHQVGPGGAHHAQPARVAVLPYARHPHARMPCFIVVSYSSTR
ncbi:hypothetical protein AB0J35_12765 [Nonomuraea angiospora]|uniref:hypothetical protein n=1 Tax=Nonomuraea angiospora TaxID=46172 RepID=UPI003414E0B1